MTNKVRTSKKVARKATKQLKNPCVSKIQKSIVASVLRNRTKK